MASMVVLLAEEGVRYGCGPSHGTWRPVLVAVVHGLGCTARCLHMHLYLVVYLAVAFGHILEIGRGVLAQPADQGGMCLRGM
jgi:hypothetical protein